MDKRVLALIIIISIIAIVLILCATVFLTREIEVDYLAQGEASIVSKDKIIQASGLKINKNILFINEKDIISKIQTTYPQVKVTDVERVFPSRVIIHLTVRVPVLKVNLNDGNVALLDREMFVTNIVSNGDALKLENEYGYQFTTVDFTLIRSEVNSGQKIASNVSEKLCVVQNVVSAFENLSLLNQDFCAFVSNISVVNTVDDSICSSEANYMGGKYVATVKTQSGVDIKLSSLNLNKMLGEAFTFYKNKLNECGIADESLTSGYFIYRNMGSGSSEFRHFDYS